MIDPKITDFDQPTNTGPGAQITKDDIIRELRRIDNLTNGAVTLSDFEKFSAYSDSPIYNSFGSIRKAREAAGLDQPETDSSCKYTDEELKKELRGFSMAFGRPPRARDDEIRPADMTFIERFGSWLAALEAAGIDPESRQIKNPPHEKFSFAELVDDILNIAAKKDRPPYKNEFIKESSVSSNLYKHLAGTWAEALQMAGLPPRYQSGNTVLKKRQPEDYGKNWKKMRNKTLERDRFRCQDCGTKNKQHKQEYGNSLHVHHLIPIREFEHPEEANFLENLITLCESCHRKWEWQTQREFSSATGGKHEC